MGSAQQQEVQFLIGRNGADSPRPLKARAKAPLCHIFYALWLRTLKDIVRNPALARAKFVQKLFMGFFLGFLYFQGHLNQVSVA